MCVCGCVCRFCWELWKTDALVDQLLPFDLRGMESFFVLFATVDGHLSEVMLPVQLRSPATAKGGPELFCSVSILGLGLHNQFRLRQWPSLEQTHSL